MADSKYNSDLFITKLSEFDDEISENHNNVWLVKVLQLLETHNDILKKDDEIEIIEFIYPH